MSQLTFAETEYGIKKRKTGREILLEKLDKLHWLDAQHTVSAGLFAPLSP